MISENLDGDQNIIICSCGQTINLNTVKSSSDHFLTCDAFREKYSYIVQAIKPMLQNAVSQQECLVIRNLFNRIYSEHVPLKPDIPRFELTHYSVPTINSKVQTNHVEKTIKPTQNSFIPNDYQDFSQFQMQEEFEMPDEFRVDSDNGMACSCCNKTFDFTELFFPESCEHIYQRDHLKKFILNQFNNQSDKKYRGTCPKCQFAFTEMELKDCLGENEYDQIISKSLQQTISAVTCINCKQTYSFEPGDMNT